MVGRRCTSRHRTATPPPPPPCAAPLAWTPLHVAARHAHAEVVRWLLDTGGGADVTARTAEGDDSAVGIAARFANADVVEAVLARGGSVEWRDAAGNAALHAAVLGANVDTCRFLLEKGGAGLEARNAEGMTPFLLACQVGSVDVLALVVRHGADVRVVDLKGRTGQQIAVASGRDEAARWVESFTPPNPPHPQTTTTGARARWNKRRANKNNNMLFQTFPGAAEAAAFLRGNSTDLILNLVIASLVACQYAILIRTATLVAPTQWPTLLPRFIRSSLPPSTACNLTPVPAHRPLASLLADDAAWFPNCTLPATLAVRAFALLGIPERAWGPLFLYLDADADGALRWPEIARCHVAPGWGCQNVVGGGTTTAAGIGPGGAMLNETEVAAAGPAVWDLVWWVEVWRRVRAMPRELGSAEWKRVEVYFGDGSDLRPALERL
ncbi:ankyrin repeat-containing domain protein [Zopfochytrium polystomum]|nr:ankyrin repeat-containing domain protein [Zopfochytrium polystomum]